MIPTKLHPKSREFCNILDEMKRLHIKKSMDYGTSRDPLANLRSSEAIGVPAWKGTYLRLRDKTIRLDTYCCTGKLANEGVEDSLMDLACYAVLALILFREQSAIGDEWNDDDVIGLHPEVAAEFDSHADTQVAWDAEAVQAKLEASGEFAKAADVEADTVVTSGGEFLKALFSQGSHKREIEKNECLTCGDDCEKPCSVGGN